MAGDIEIRRQKVKRLLAQGAQINEMADRLDVSRSTVYRDIDAIEDEVEELREGDIQEFLVTLKSNYETMQQELWNMYFQQKGDNENAALGALKQLNRTNSDYVDVLQKTGILDAAASKVEVSGGGGGPIEFSVIEAAQEGHSRTQEVRQRKDGEIEVVVTEESNGVDLDELPEGVTVVEEGDDG